MTAPHVVTPADLPAPYSDQVKCRGRASVNSPARPNHWRWSDMRDRTCAVDGCEREGSNTLGWCQMHAKRWRRTGTTARINPKPGPMRGWCKVSGCLARLHAGGYCTSHFLRDKRHGDPLAGGAFRDHRPLSERFMEQVEVSDGCWLWVSSLATSGYGVVRSEAETHLAHRVSWEIHVGPIPDGLHLDHLCHNADLTCWVWDECLHRACVSPAHLEPVTPEENHRRMWQRQAIRRLLVGASHG